MSLRVLHLDELTIQEDTQHAGAPDDIGFACAHQHVAVLCCRDLDFDRRCEVLLLRGTGCHT